MREIIWSYGVTTVPERRVSHLPQTLAALAAAGFDRPRLFIDQCAPPEALSYAQSFQLPVTARDPKINVYGNWILALWELYLRNTQARRYAIFQDDLVTYKNLRAYLDQCIYPGEDQERSPVKGYWNLYTFPENYEQRQRVDGWYPSNQMGRGAVALVFNRQAVQDLLASQHMVIKPTDAHRGWRSVDGGITEALCYKLGYKEYVHHPSLVQHTGLRSSMPTQLTHPLAPNFLGENFDALNLVQSA